MLWMCRLFIVVVCLGLALGLVLRSGSLAAENEAKPAAEPAVRTDRYGDPLPPGAIARLGTVRLRQPGGVRCLTFSPDGQLLASVGTHGDSLILWDVATGKERLCILPEDTISDAIHTVAFSPDGKSLAAATRQGTLLWETAT